MISFQINIWKVRRKKFGKSEKFGLKIAEIWVIGEIDVRVDGFVLIPDDEGNVVRWDAEDTQMCKLR